MTTKLVGLDAIEFARTHKLQLQKNADPIDGAREVSAAEALEIVLADPQLVYLTLPWARVEQTATAAILWEGACDSARAALSSLEEMAGAPEEGWGDGVVVHEYWLDADGAPIAKTTPASEVTTGPLSLVEAELKRVGVYDEGEGGVVVQEVEGAPGLVEIADESVSGRYRVAELLPLLRGLGTNLESHAPEHTRVEDAIESPGEWAYAEFWQAMDPAEVKEATPAKIARLYGRFSVRQGEAENALVAAFRPFGSLTTADAEPDAHERKLAKAVLAWVNERPLLDVSPIHSLLQLLWTTDANQLTTVGELRPYLVELVTPTSGTRIRCSRSGAGERTIEIKFGEGGSAQRAETILAAAQAFGVRFEVVLVGAQVHQ